MGRSHIFGDCQHLGRNYQAHWTRLVRRSAVITGLHVDSQFGLGVTSKPAPRTAKRTAPATIDRPLVLPPLFSSGFPVLTKASIMGIRRLRTNRERPHCKGLLIERHDGTVDVLGAWDPANPSGIETIYDEATQTEPLTGILVRTTRFGDWRRVRNIAALLGDSTPPRGYKVYRDTASKPRYVVFRSFANSINRLWHGGGMNTAT